MKKFPMLVLTLLGGLVLWMSLNMQDAKAGEGATVADATYGKPTNLMTPFSLTDDSENYITFKYDEFYPSDSRLIVNLNATISNIVNLTPAQTNKAGSVFNKERVSLQDDRSFSTYFTFKLSAGGGYGDGWADGLVFTVQTQSNSAGSIGGTLGYNGITPSVGIKFDTWQNNEHGDPSNNHTAILKNGVIGSPLVVKAIDPAVLNLRGGTIHVWVDYDGPNGVLEVRLNKDSSTRPADADLSYTMAEDERLTSILNSDWVYVGFTAATGGAYQKHDITSWYFTNKLDPIDIENKTYKQAPTGYTIAPVTLEDGTVELTITPTGGDDDKQVALSVEGTDGAVIDPASANTGEEGQAVVIASSPDGETLVTTITVTGPGGVASSQEITIPGRTDAPIAERIAANATDGTVAVTGVPEGATVTVYDHEGNKLAAETGVTGGEVLMTGLVGLTAANPIAVTFELSPKVESAKTAVVPKVRSVLDASDVQVNATTDKATIRDVPAGAVIRVYDAPGGHRIGEGTNEDSSAAAIVVQLDAPGVGHKQKVYATIQETGELESLPVEIEALAESAKLDGDQVVTDGTADRVTVREVPAGATIIIYDEDGHELGRGVNAAAADSDVAIDELGLVIGMSIRVTMVEADKLESQPVTVAVTFTQSDAPGDIDANATKSIVAVKDVPPGTTATVYDEDGLVLDTVLNAEASPATVNLTFVSPRLLQGQALDITLTEPRKTESVKVRVTAYYEQTAMPQLPDVLDIDIEAGSVKMGNVPAGATVIIYDQDDREIGRGLYGGAAAGEIVIPGLTLETVFRVTYTEPNKYESDPLTVDIDSATQEAIDDAVSELEVGYQEDDTWESVTLPLFVVSVGKHNTSVSWTSGKPGVIEITDPTDDWIEALVHRQAQDESVILTAKVSKNGKFRVRTFLVIVKAVGLEKTVEENYRQVKVTGGADEEVDEQVDINRVLLSDGSKIDKAIFDEATATQFVGDARTRNSVSRVYVDEVPGDEPDEFAVEVPETVMRLLAGNGNSLEVRTDYGGITIDGSKVGEMVDNALDLFFRLVPVKDANRQREINAGIRREAIVQAEAGGKVVDIIGASLKVETNYSGYTTVLTLYFEKNGIRVPAANAAAFLDSLRVYIEHSDGTKAVTVGTAVYEGGVPVGLSIENDKFSTFSILQLKDRPETEWTETEAYVQPPEELPLLNPGYHAAYIKGFEDGTFRPNNPVTRAEIAAILARNMNLPESVAYRRLYPDVPSAHWAWSDIERLKGVGLLVGDTDGRFRPQDAITRAEMAMIAAKWLDADLRAAVEQPFPDVADSHWAAAAIAAANHAGVIVGFTDGTFGPDALLTRAQAVAIINRLLGRRPLIDAASPSWPDVSASHWAYGEIEEASRDHYYLYDAGGNETWTDPEG